MKNYSKKKNIVNIKNKRTTYIQNFLKNVSTFSMIAQVYGEIFH